jgi:hypothetical protein
VRFLDQYALRDKKLLRLERELNRLHQAQGNAPIIPLERPYQRGWVKSYTLREDALHHPDIRFFAAVLKVVNQKVYAKKREFISRCGEEMVLHPRIIPAREWSRLAWPIGCQRLFAYGHWWVEDIFPWTPKRWRQHIIGFKLIRFWWLEEIVEPHLITHQRVELPEVRSRIAEIESFFSACQGRNRLSRLHGRRCRWFGDPDPARIQRAAASFDDQLDQPCPKTGLSTPD